MRHDLTSLALFVAVAECGNLTRAAERQHLAVSAVSKRVADLETLVGASLFVRQSRGVMLTPAGLSLLQHARQLLQLVQQMDDELHSHAGGIKGLVRLQVVASALTGALPGELERFLSRHPQVQLSLQESVGLAVVRAVADGTADLGIVAHPTPLDSVHSFPYRSDRVVLVAPHDHPLCRHQRVRFAQALAYAFIGPHADSSLHRLLRDGARLAGVPLQQRVQVSSFEAMRRLVATRLGIAVLPEGAAQGPAAEEGLAVIGLDEPWASRRLDLLVRDAAQLSPVTRALIEQLRGSPG